MMDVKVIEQENGHFEACENGTKEIEVFQELTKEEFEKRFPEVNTYGLSWTECIFLESGVFLHENEWNGEEYTGDYGTYRVLYKVKDEDEDQYEIVGYYKL